MTEICHCGGKIHSTGGTTRLTPDLTRRYGTCRKCGQRWVMHVDKSKISAKEKYSQFENAQQQKAI